MNRISDFVKKYRVVVAIFAVVLIVALSAAGVLIYQVQSDTKISARDAVITNISDTSFTVTWVSDEPYIGRVIYKEGDEKWGSLFAQQGQAFAWDDRDIELNEDGQYVQVPGGAKERYTHHVTLRNLKPETVYSFRVGGKINGKSLSATNIITRPIIKQLNTPDPAYGKVENIVENDSLIIIGDKQNASETANLISTPVSASSTYSLDMNYFARSDLEGDDLYAIVRSGNKLISQHDFKGRGYKPLEAIVVSDRGQQNSAQTNLQSRVVIDANAQASCPVSKCISIGAVTNIREDAGTGFAILSKEGGGIEKKIFSCKSGWYEIETNTGQRGYVLGSLFTAKECLGGSGGVVPPTFPPATPPANTPPTSPPGTSAPPSNPPTIGGGTFSCNGLGEVAVFRASQNINLRPQPNTLLGAVGKLSGGAQVNGCAQKVDGVNPYGSGSSPWVRVDNGGSEAYIWAQLLTLATGGSQPTSGTSGESTDNKQDGDEEAAKVNTTNGGSGGTNTPPDAEVVDGNNVYFPYGNSGDDSSFKAFAASEWSQETSSLGRSDKLELSLNGVPLCNASGPSSEPVRCSISLAKYYNGTVSRNRNKDFVGCLFHHELVHRVQQTCRSSILNIGGSSELGAEYAAVQRCSSNSGAYGDGDYIFKVYVGGRPVSDWVRAREAKKRIDDALASAKIDFDLINLVNCRSAELSKYQSDPVLAQRLKDLKISIMTDIGNHTIDNNTIAGSPFDPAYTPTNVVAHAGEYDYDHDHEAETLGVNTSIVKSAEAQEKNTIDGSGEYEILFNGQVVRRDVIAVHNDTGKVTTNLFEDTNNNGKYDQGEKVISSDEIEVRKVSSNLEYELSAGWNLISIPGFINIEDLNYTAQSLAYDISHSSGVEITKVAKFEDGKFVIYSTNGFGEDFKIMPGQGIFVFSTDTRKITIRLSEVAEKFPLTLENGWNLVGFSGYEGLTTDKVFDAASAQKINLTTLSQFENGRYESVVVDAGIRFGNGYNIVNKRGYFIRAETTEKKSFTP